MSRHVDDIVVGAGIVGLAHAWHLAKAGRRVQVFERGPRAAGASVRNFGMVWPIGQPPGRMRQLALRSRALWQNVLESAGLWHRACGSLHIASHDDERQVIEEFAEQAREDGFPCRVIEPAEIGRLSPLVRHDRTVGGLWSEHELNVDPRQVVAALPEWLASTYRVGFSWHTAVTCVDGQEVVAGTERWSASRVWVCSGDDLTTLFPDLLGRLGLVRCKLQMMRTTPVEGSIGPMIAGGLTLAHYRGFATCPSLPALVARFDRDLPEHRRYGIHVMASQMEDRALVLGDSHEYDDHIEPFDKARIDELVMEYLGTFVRTDGIAIDARWHGVYLKHPEHACVTAEPQPGVACCVGLGGAGMTLSFAVAESHVADVLSW